MKKLILSFSLLVLVSTFSIAQTLNDAVKLIQYKKLKSAKDALQKLYAANASDANAIYWLGQVMIEQDDVVGAKALYQKSLQSGVTDVLLSIGMAHVDLLQGGDWATANQKFEFALTSTAETRGKNKGKSPIYIYNAIGRANVIGHLVKDGSSKFGNVDFAVDKLKIAKDIDATNTDCLILMGLAYRKMGGEFGGEAQKAYTEALQRNPNLAQANHLLGKIYSSQQNKSVMEQYFNAAIANDVAYAPVYLDYYNYYSNRDVSVAKDNIEKYMQYADKDCNINYFYADYLFRSGNYQASLAKAKELESTDCKERVAVLYAYNYDRMNDSVQARASIENFMSSVTPDKILQTDYDIAVKILSRFSGAENQAVSYINKIIEMDNSKQTQLAYLSQASNLYEKSKDYTEQIKIIQRIADLRGTTSEYDYYKMSEAAMAGNNFTLGTEVAKKYMTAFPDKPQGYDYLVRNAKKMDTANNTGIVVEATKMQNTFLMRDTAKYKQKIINNYYTQMAYYNDVVKDYNKAVECCDEILKLVPNEPQTLKLRETLKRNAEKKSSTPTPPNTPKTPSTPKAPVKTTGSIKNDVKKEVYSNAKK